MIKIGDRFKQSSVFLRVSLKENPTASTKSFPPTRPLKGKGLRKGRAEGEGSLLCLLFRERCLGPEVFRCWWKGSKRAWLDPSTNQIPDNFHLT